MNLSAEHGAHQIAQFASAGLKDKGLTINLIWAELDPIRLDP